MFNFEDELILEPGVSWLIWIQLLVIILIFALYCLTVFAVDFSKSSTESNSSAAVASSSTSRFVCDAARKGKNLPNQNFRIDSNRPRKTQVWRFSACVRIFVFVAGYSWKFRNFSSAESGQMCCYFTLFSNFGFLDSTIASESILWFFPLD